jgi:acetyltransferase-like isoleucine patch superfamily enzyme
LSSLKGYLKNVLLRLKNDGLALGAGCVVNQVNFGKNVRLGNAVTALSSDIQDYSYIGNNGVVSNASIGKFCSIASEVHVGAGSHPSSVWVSTHPIFYLSKPAIGWNFVTSGRRAESARTVIGNDVWLGTRATIKDGVRVGDGAIVGAGAVVTNDLDPYGVYVGIPAKLARYRFEPDEIAFLQSLRWWDKDLAWIRQNADAFRDIALLMVEQR